MEPDFRPASTGTTAPEMIRQEAIGYWNLTVIVNGSFSSTTV
jgi:hypothetical protein